MERNLALEAVRVTEAAALASARLMGRGDVAAADHAGAQAMRKAFASININGVVVIGEGAQHESDVLYIGEHVGSGTGDELDVALDALEGATICATGGYNALSIIAIAERDGFLRCPDMYMEKIVVGPDGVGAIDLDKSATENLRLLAEMKGVYVADLTVAVLDRPRHEKLITEARKAGARVKLLSDGDVAAGMAASKPGSGIDLLMGVGGAHQGILTAAAVRCTGGAMHGRLRTRNNEDASHAADAGITDLTRKYTEEEMASGSVMFAATGVTDGDYVHGVHFFKGGATTNSVVMRSRTRTIRFIEAVHRFDFKPEY
ncbi:MAG: class II fructose-bisphosphatase [Deltaproteobacteria bacterium]|nr:class II fructose-bisphosphatase [Deltaproteobacteria bacterium]MBI3391318.1 class II fructose-bisphosphatase [Deltaproteobacteria bacterium]